MRIFVAIPMPDLVKQGLADLEQPIEGIRWQREGQYHLTLKFLGDTDEGRVAGLKRALDEINLGAFSIHLKGFGYFPQGKQPRVLWVGIAKNKQLQKLQQKIEKICQSLAFEAEDRPFKPHITLARMNGVAKRDVMSFINQHKQFQIPEVPVHEFVLYESKLHSNGAMHIPVKTFSLK